MNVIYWWKRRPTPSWMNMYGYIPKKRILVPNFEGSRLCKYLADWIYSGIIRWKWFYWLSRRCDVTQYLDYSHLALSYHQYLYWYIKYIFFDFSRNQSATEERIDCLIDLDLILSSSVLHNNYKIDALNNFDFEMVLPMFSFIHIPKGNITFIQPHCETPILIKNKVEITIFLLARQLFSFIHSIPNQNAIRIYHFYDLMCWNSIDKNSISLKKNVY